MTENEIAKVVVDVAYQIHSRLGPGLLESAYHAIMLHELHKTNMQVQSEVPIPILWDGVHLEVGFRADLLIEKKVVVELKSVAEICR